MRKSHDMKEFEEDEWLKELYYKQLLLLKDITEDDSPCYEEFGYLSESDLELINLK